MIKRCKDNIIKDAKKLFRLKNETVPIKDIRSLFRLKKENKKKIKDRAIRNLGTFLSRCKSLS